MPQPAVEGEMSGRTEGGVTDRNRSSNHAQFPPDRHKSLNGAVDVFRRMRCRHLGADARLAFGTTGKEKPMT